MSNPEQLALWPDKWHDPHRYQSGGKWANECICGEHWLDAIHRNLEDKNG